MPHSNKKITKALTPARQLALRTLLCMQARREKIQASLNATLGACPTTMKQIDKALATELVYGCVRLKIRLDWILNRYFTKPDAVPSALRRVLRMAVYELLYLDGIPSYATLSSYVDAVKAGYGAKLAGLANAVLRKVSQISAHDEEWFRQEIVDEKEFMTIWYSLPTWMLEHFLANFPEEEAKKYMAASLETPPLGLRLNRQHENKEELETVAQTLRETEGFWEQKGAAIAFRPGFTPEKVGSLQGKGLLSRQSLASQEVMRTVFEGLNAEVAEALELGPIWDICAGQGGKTAWLLDHGYPVALCSDTNLPRLQGLSREIKRLRHETPLIFKADASRPLPIKSATAEAREGEDMIPALTPGIILVDAPCSGLGTLARRPDIKIYRTPNDLAGLVKLQEAILNTAFAALPKSGLLVYITCTLNPDENEKAIDRLLQKNNSAKQIFSWATPKDTLAKEFFWAAVVKKTE